MLNFSSVTPRRHILARNRVFWRILRQNSLGRLGCGWFPKPKNSRVNNLVTRSRACAETKPLIRSGLNFAE